MPDSDRLNNVDVTADELGQLERVAIGPVRHGALLDAPSGQAIRLPAKPLALAAPEERGGSVITPQGYLVDLNQDGTFRSITLAVGTGDAVADNALRSDGTGTPPVVDRHISNLLTTDNLFLVVTDAPAQWHFKTMIGVAGFDLLVDFSDRTRPAILIFKFNPKRTLKDLATDPGSWSEGGTYVGDVARTVARLTALFEEAGTWPASENNPFAAFNKPVTPDKPLQGVLEEILTPLTIQDETMAPFVRFEAAAIAAAHAHYRGPKTAVILDLRVTLFGSAQGQPVPLVPIDPLPLDVTHVDADWWQPAG